jgi:peptidoglycan/LPS O-acetylase OafA/YrhL
MYAEQPVANVRNEDIEVLRAYAVLLVLFEHLQAITESTTIGNLRTFMNGWTGVDLFFCVSGFVIYRSISSSLTYRMPWAAAIRQVVVFWIRRFWRLAPAATLWLALGIPLVLTYRSAEIGLPIDNLADGIASLLSVENFHIHSCNVQAQICGRLFPVYWSLSLEAQFYVALPVALILFRRSWVVIGLLAMIVLQVPLNRPANGTAIAWFVRTDAIAWGILIALVWEAGLARLIEPRFLRARLSRLFFTFGLIFLLGTSQILWRLQFFVSMVALFSACLVWAASYNKRYISRAFGANWLLLWIGHRSFSLYVAHMIVFKAVRQIFQLAGILDLTSSGKLLYLGAAYAGTFAAAAATYSLVERPLRQVGRNYAREYLLANPVISQATEGAVRSGQPALAKWEKTIP